MASVILAAFGLIADWVVHTKISFWIVFMLFGSILMLPINQAVYSLKLIHTKNPNIHFLPPQNIGLWHWLSLIPLVGLSILDMHFRYQLKLPTQSLQITLTDLSLIVFGLPYFFIFFYKILIR